MADSALLIVSGIFLFAGLVKGMVGLGLPTIAMGLLCLSSCRQLKRLRLW